MQRRNAIIYYELRSSFLCSVLEVSDLYVQQIHDIEMYVSLGFFENPRDVLVSIYVFCALFLACIHKLCIVCLMALFFPFFLFSVSSVLRTGYF